MSGTRFARSGRCRFFVCLGVLVLMLCMVAIFHSSQQQLDETREQRMRCERQQEALNEQLQSMVEQKYELEKSCEQERNEQMETRRHLEQKLKELTIQRTNEQMDVQARYDKLQQSHKQLQSEQNECHKKQKQIMEDANAMDKKLQSVRSELEKEKKVLNEEVTMWKEKHNVLTHENSRLELLLGTAGPKMELLNQISALKDTVAAYESHCAFRPVAQAPNPSQPANASPQPPRAVKSFSEQVRILSQPLEKVASDDRDGGDGGAEAQLQQPINKPAALVAGKMVSPLSAPRKAAATEPTKSEQHVLEANAPMKPVNGSSTTSSSGLPPLPMPPSPRKLPENVAPIPANFEELLKNDHANHKVGDAKSEHDANAAEEVDQQKHEDANNNRYANVVNNMEQKGAAGANAAGNEDSGAHEIKDNDFMNDQNFNLPAEEANNFFDGGGKAEAGGGAADEKPKDEDNDEDDGLAAVDAGDIAVKNHNHLLDTNNLNNEVAADQGKEFPDELRLEEAAEEDEDEDDYSNPAARQQGGQAIRN